MFFSTSRGLAPGRTLAAAQQCRGRLEAGAGVGPRPGVSETVEATHTERGDARRRWPASVSMVRTRIHKRPGRSKRAAAARTTPG